MSLRLSHRLKAVSTWLNHSIDHLSLAVATLGFVVSAAALAVAWQANHISNQGARKSTDPYLIYEHVVVPSESPDGHELDIRVHNVGLGPAFILNFEAYRNGEPVTGQSLVNGHDVAKSYGFASQSDAMDDIKFGQVIPPNERVTVFKITKWHQPMSRQQFKDLTTRGEMAHLLIICYRSVYADRYFATLNPKVTIPPGSCASRGNYKQRPPLPDPSRIELESPDAV